MFGGRLRSVARRLRPLALGVASGTAACTATLWAGTPLHNVVQAQAQQAEPGNSSGTWASGAAAGGAIETGLRLVSYNVLSDALCDAEFFDCCAPEDVDNDTRLARVKRKLQAEMEQGAVICLQEISRNWAGELLPLYEQYGYGHMEACSGSAFGGYMGVSLAWPQAKFSCEEIQAKKIGETVDWPQPKRTWYLSELRPTLIALSIHLCLAGAGKWTKEKPPFNARQEALGRHNCSIIARLRSTET